MKKYLKNFSIMLIMAFTIIFGNFVNAFADDTNVNWNTYDDDNAIFMYDNLADWHNGDTANFLNGGTHNSKDSTKKSSVKFNFIGTQFRLKVQCYINGRNKNINVYIDGKLANNFSAPQTLINGHVQYYESPELKYGEHSVSIEKGELYNDGFIMFDQVDINGKLLPYKESITLDKSTMDLTEGDSAELTATVSTTTSAQVTWTSSESSVATVDSTGKVTGTKEGQAIITAKTADGLIATCVVTVTKKTEPIPTPEPTDSDKIVNIAHAKGDNTNNAGGDVKIIFHGSADTTLSVVKTADVKDVWVGDNFTYTLVITNTGTKTAKAVVVNDPAPNHIDFNVSGVTTTQGNVDSSSTSKNIIVNVGDILPGGTVTIKIPSTVIA
jgi:uncharacterized repeat protein (TIGR01451 family)